MKQIAFVLYHLSEVNNWILKLLPYLLECKISIIHIGRLHHMKAPEIVGVSFYDVSGISYKSAQKIICDLHPDVCVFFSFRSLYEMAFEKICDDLEVKRVYLEHGLFSSDTLTFEKGVLKSQLFDVIRRQSSFFKLYIRGIICGDNLIGDFKNLYKLYFKGQFRILPFGHYYIYGLYSLNNLSKVYDLSIPENTTLVGYPIFNNNEEKKISESNIIDGDGVLYVHQPLIADGLSSASFHDEKIFICNMAEHLKSLSDRYQDFTILLHPRANYDEYINRYKGSGINVIQSPNNYNIFADKALIVGHYSTALLYGLYFHKPIVTTKFPGSKKYESYKNMFISCIPHIEDLSLLHSVVSASSKDDIYNLIGPNNTYESIAQTILHDIL